MSNSHRDKSPQDPLGVWERIAGFWDDYIGEGNDFQQVLIMPTTDRLLEIKPGELVLDACCGNGNYARRLANAGAKVVAFDGSAAFIERAKAREAPDSTVDYHVLDATDESSLLTTLGDQARFDAAVSSMALMDLAEIDPLLRVVRRILKPTGRFVFSVSHPAFNSIETTLTADLVQPGGKPKQLFGVKVTRYATPAPYLSYGILHQPEPHWMFHRPLSVLLGACFRAGFIVDAFEEPSFELDAKAKNAFSWAKRPEIPPAILVRLRPV
jgi:SAM-dependent methyltransferase